MKVVRHGVWETNSSSTHSITIGNQINQEPQLRTNEHGYVEVYCDDYGWGGGPLDTVQEKLEYLVCYLINCYIPGCYEPYNFYTSDFYHRICEVLNVKGITVKNEGYIDHQSCDCNNDITEYIDDNESLKKYLLDPTIHVIISNDNC